MTRVVRHFHSALQADVSVHVVGTGALLYAPYKLPLAQRDFHVPNVADLFFAHSADKAGVPRICVRRHVGWIVGHVVASEGAGIWQRGQDDIASSTARNPADTAHTADGSSAVDSRSDTVGGAAELAPPDVGPILRDVANVLVPATVAMRGSFPLSRGRVPGRLKLLMAITTWNRLEFLRIAVESWRVTRSAAYDWTLVIADDGSTDGTLEWLSSLRMEIDVELFVLRNQGLYVVGQTNTVFELGALIGYDFGFKADDDVIFKKSGWDALYVKAWQTSAVDHLVYLNLAHRANLVARQGLTPMMNPPVRDTSGLLEARVDAWGVDGSLWTFTPALIARIGGGDEENFPIRGQWHVDLTLRAARAGMVNMSAVFDAARSNAFITLQVVTNTSAYRPALPWGPAYKLTKDAAEMARRERVMSNSRRVFVPLPEPRFPATRFQPAPLPACKPCKSKRGCSGRPCMEVIAQQVACLSTVDSGDRWARFAHRAAAAGVAVRRLIAVSAASPGAEDAYAAYLARPRAVDTASAEAQALVTWSADFHTHYESLAARAAFVERTRGRPPLTQGAFFYLLTYQRFLMDAMLEGADAVALFDDDAVFHSEFERRLRDVLPVLPDGWLVCYLGAMQYSFKNVVWGQPARAPDLHKPPTGFEKQTYYHGRGSSIASHAVVIRAPAFLRLFGHMKQHVLPVDDGALSTLCATLPHACVTLYPNLVIQDLAMNTTIGSSKLVADTRAWKDKAATFRWNTGAYEF
jgi:hypothetical protein